MKAATPLLESANSKLWKLTKYTEEAQVTRYQVDAIVKVVEIQPLMGEANDYIESNEQKRVEVNSTVEEIRALLKNLSHKLMLSNSVFLTNDEGDLSKVSSKIKDEEEAKKEMVKYKSYVDDFLKEIKKKTGESAAEKKLDNIKFHAKNAADSLAMITKALNATGINVRNTNSRKQDLLQALSRKITKPGSKEGMSTERPQQLAGERTKITVNKEKMSTSEAHNDSAITVDFSLPLVLVFVAALH